MRISTTNINSTGLQMGHDKSLGLKKKSGVSKRKPNLYLGPDSKETKELMKDEILLMTRKIEQNPQASAFIKKHPCVWHEILREEDEDERRELFSALIYDENHKIDGMDFNLLSI